MAQSPQPAPPPPPPPPPPAPPTEEQLEKALAEATANLAAFRARAKVQEEIDAIREKYEADQVALEASEETLRENQADEEARLAAVLGANAAQVAAAAQACRDEVAALESSVESQRAAVKAQEQAAAEAADKARNAKAAYDRQKDAVKAIQASHKAADAYRLEAMKARKDNPGLAYYLVSVKFKEELDRKPDPVEADDFEQALKDASEDRIAADRDQVDAEGLLKTKKAALAESEKALAALRKDLETRIRAEVSKVKPAAPPQPAPPAPPPEPPTA